MPITQSARPESADAAPPRARHSIRLGVLAGTLVLALCATAFGTVHPRAALNDRREALALQAASDVLTSLSRATIELSLERSVSQVMMERPGPAEPVFLQMIAEQRRRADVGLAAAIGLAPALQATRLGDAFVTEVARLRAALGPVRAAFDREIKLPAAQRDPAQVDALPRDLKELVASFQSQRHPLRGPGFALPTEIAMLEAVRDQAWQIREYGGRERTYLAIAAANGSAIGAARLAEMSVLARRAEDGWTDITGLARHGSLQPEMVQALRAVEQGYFGSYARLRAAMLAQAGAAAPAYPVTFDAFFAASSEALHAVEGVAALSGKAIDGYWQLRAGDTLGVVVVDSVALAVAVLVGLSSALLTARAFRRLNRIGGRMQALAGGDVEAAIPDITAPDEVGVMARAVEVFRETARQRTALEQEAAAREEQETGRRRTEMAKLVGDFTGSVGGVMQSLADSAERMDEASQDLASATARTGDLARTTTDGAHASARDLATVAGATGELSNSVRDIAREVSAAATTARAMSAQANGTESAMLGLAQAADRIGAVTRLISEIAGQTNLLALNATIEAARAGDAGKGFAVVAAEVKQLASRTAAATGEIAQQIDAIQTTTREAVSAVRGMAEEVRHMENMAGTIAAAVEQQGAAVQDITQSIATVTGTTNDSVDAMTEATAAAEAARGASTTVREAAATVRREASQLDTRIADFRDAMLRQSGAAA